MIIWNLLYSGILEIRKMLYCLGIFKSHQTAVKILSVGNLTFGGTGKSPLVSFLLDKFSNNIKVAVLSRGYGRKSRGFLKVDKQNLNGAEIYGDEPFMLAQNHPDISVYVCENRVNGVNEILKKEKVDWVFLDDAFQHLKIKKNVNIVIVDATEDLKNYNFPPFGRLRSRKQDIFEADIKVLTKVNLVEPYKIQEIHKLFNTSDFIEIESHIEAVRETISSEILSPQKVILISGIAKPKNFENSVKMLGYDVVEHFAFQDHYRYQFEDIQKIVKKYPNLPIIITEKDYAKLCAFKDFTFYVTKLKFKERNDLKKFYDIFN